MNIINKIKEKLSQYRENRYIKKLQLSNPNPRIFYKWEHNSWGDTISILSINNDGTFRISGHLVTKPVVGDYLIYITQSWRKGRGIISEVKYPGDPWDMFFATVIPIDYYEETNTNDKL